VAGKGPNKTPLLLENVAKAAFTSFNCMLVRFFSLQNLKKMIIFSTILLLAGFVIFSSADNPRVKTQVGVIEGFEHVNKDGSKSHIYLGIRYARPPVGELRLEVRKAFTR
jgi:hypothetical protein